MNNYNNFTQSFSNFETIYIFDEESNSVVDSGELRDCQAEIDSYIDECSSLFLNDFLVEELASPSVDFDDDTVVDIIPGRSSDLDNYLRESEIYTSFARNLGLDISNMSFLQLKNAVLDSIIKNSNDKEVKKDEKKDIKKEVEAPVSQNGDKDSSEKC